MKRRPSDIAAVTRPMMRRKSGERSFSLIETVIALSIVTFLIIEVSTVQGNAIVFSDYGRNLTQATWLAKRVMSNVEYRAGYAEFKELQHTEKEIPFEDFPEFQYSVDIKEWKLSLSKIMEMAMGGGGGPSEDDKEKSSADEAKDKGEASFIEQGVKQVFGDEPIFLTAQVEVSWPDGATRSSVTITNLFTNQNKVDAYIMTLRPVWEQVTKAAAGKGNNNQQPPQPQVGPDGKPLPPPVQPTPPVPPVPPVNPDGGGG